MAWSQFFEPERIAHPTQAVVASGRIYVGAKSGIVRCLALADGKLLWQATLGGMVCNSAAVDAEAGVVAVPCHDGILYGLDAASGELRWKRDTGFGITAAPVLYGGAFIVGNRRGRMVSVKTADGALNWEKSFDAPVFASPAAADGRVYIGVEDMRMYCLDAATGETLWRSDQTRGMSFVHTWPVVHRGKVFTTVVLGINGALGVNGGPEQINFGKVLNWRRDLFPPGIVAEAVTTGVLPQDVTDSLPELRAFYERHPFLRSMYVFDATTGAQPFVPCHMHCGTLNGPPMPPCIDPEGMLVHAACIYYPCFTRLDPDTGDIIDLLSPYFEKEGALGGNADEIAGFSSSADTVFFAHGGHSIHAGIGGGGAFMLKPERKRLPGGRDFPVPANKDKRRFPLMMTSGYTPGENPFVIVDNRVVFVHYSAVHVWEGAR